jgi:hypothetical protein
MLIFATSISKSPRSLPLCAGGGPTLDYADATAFLAVFECMIEQAHRRRLQ